MHSVSDLTTSSRKTSGTVPPKLVGASTTIVGDKLYLFGGRLVAERRMVSDLYVFDLETFVWTRVPPYTGDDVPGARYFHSADSCKPSGPFCFAFGSVPPSAVDKRNGMEVELRWVVCLEWHDDCWFIMVRTSLLLQCRCANGAGFSTLFIITDNVQGGRTNV